MPVKLREGQGVETANSDPYIRCVGNARWDAYNASIHPHLQIKFLLGGLPTQEIAQAWLAFVTNLSMQLLPFRVSCSWRWFPWM
jgi:hypothetical protein